MVHVLLLSSTPPVGLPSASFSWPSLTLIVTVAPCHCSRIAPAVDGCRVPVSGIFTCVTSDPP